MPNIVIVEDELIAAEYLKEILQKNDFHILDIIDNGQEAIKKIPFLKPDIALMDIMLKDNISGSEVAVKLKASSSETAIIFLTAYADNEMIEYAANSNCHGYLIKPYKEKEILTAIKLVLAKNNHSDSIKTQILIRLSENIYFDTELKRLIKDGKEIELNKKMILLFDLLCKTPNRTVSNETICLALWGGAINPITLRTFMHRIKNKIGDDLIHNVNRLGYMIKTFEN
jgi:DNA-binding response OmpR family regulator